MMFNDLAVVVAALLVFATEQYLLEVFLRQFKLYKLCSLSGYLPQAWLRDGAEQQPVGRTTRVTGRQIGTTCTSPTF